VYNRIIIICITRLLVSHNRRRVFLIKLPVKKPTAKLIITTPIQEKETYPQTGNGSRNPPEIRFLISAVPLIPKLEKKS
jgi:hypothetical protein